MARGVNKVILIGNLGQDPEVRYMPNGNAVTNITLATTDSWKDRESGQQQERTEWHRIVFFNKLAEIAGQYLRKGSSVYIEGALRTRKWQDKEGQDRYTTEIVADQMQMLGGRGDSNDAGGYAPQQNAPQQASSQQYAPQQNAPRPQSAPQQQAPSQPAQKPAGFDDFDDDIPF